MSVLSALSLATPPSAAIEFAGNHVTAAVLQMRAGGPSVTSHATDALPAGALVPGLMAGNIRDRAAVADALARLLDRLGSRPKRVGVIIPDPVAKVSLVRFERVPSSAHDLDQLVRWQVRRTAPFPLEEAQVTYVAGERFAEAQEFVVSIARRTVVEEYESLCVAAGLNPGLVDISSFSVINAALAGSIPAGDWMLINVAADYASIAILRGEHLIFFRNRTAETEGSLADVVHQATMYYEDRLGGGGFDRVVLSGGTTGRAREEVEETRRVLQERSNRAIETLDPLRVATLTDRIAASPELRKTLSPLVGLLLRDRVVRA